MKKRGQTTTFIVIGLLLVITVSMIIFIRNLYFQATEVEAEILRDQPTTLPPLKTYVQECITSSSKWPIENIGKYGGVFSDILHSHYRKEITYHNKSYWSIAEFEDGLGLVNFALTRQLLEKELEKNISQRLNRCINLSLFEKLGYDVDNGTLDVDVTVSVDDVTIKAIYPIRVEKVDDVQEEEEYQSVYKAPIGMMFDLYVKIINNEILNGGFDKDSWMLNHSSQIRIHKHRPYPDIVYLLEKDDEINNISYFWQFSIIGRDTQRMIGKEIKFDSSTGFDCYNDIDKNCYYNLKNPSCSFYNLSSSFGPCEGLTSFQDPNINTRPCVIDGNYSNGTYVPHGKTWCLSDTPSGNGNEFAGSRFYLLSCIDGEIYYEDCRDYREELCTYDPSIVQELFTFKETIGGPDIPYVVHGKAVCRPNRWQDCVVQENAYDCLDETKRDCLWNNATGTGLVSLRDMCTPIVSLNVNNS
jgi:hypothetical protein